MWLAYVNIAPASNLISAIENLAQHFTNLEFDAEHEYWMEKFYSKEECMEIASKYQKGVEACNIYLQNFNLNSFLYTIKELKLSSFLDEVEKFVSKSIMDEIFLDEENKINL